jgi:hypothetical protein
VHAATNEFEAAEATTTVATSTVTDSTTTATLGWVWTTPSGEPGSTDWRTGNYTAVLDATVNDGNFSYAVGTIGGVAGHFARVDSGLTADQTTHEMVETDFTGTGLKSASTGSVSFGTAGAGDRFEIAVVYQRADSHGTKSLSLDLNEADDIVTGQWSATPAKADLTITGYAPAAVETDRVFLFPAKADLTVTGQTPLAQVNTQLAPAKADLTVTGYAPEITFPVPAATLTITGHRPTILDMYEYQSLVWEDGPDFYAPLDESVGATEWEDIAGGRTVTVAPGETIDSAGNDSQIVDDPLSKSVDVYQTVAEDGCLDSKVSLTELSQKSFTFEIWAEGVSNGPFELAGVADSSGQTFLIDWLVGTPAGTNSHIQVTYGSTTYGSTPADDFPGPNVFLRTQLRSPNHIAVVYDAVAETLTVYINGGPRSVFTSVSAETFSEADNIFLGGHNPNGGAAVGGSYSEIDQPAIYLRALSADEIFKHYTVGQISKIGNTALTITGYAPVVTEGSAGAINRNPPKADLTITTFAPDGGEFPYIVATNSTDNSTVSASHTIDLPASITEGDLLIAVVGVADSASQTITWPAGWDDTGVNTVIEQDNGNTIRLAARQRIADGTEGSSIAVTLVTAVRGVAASLRIKQGTRVSGSVATGTSTDSNPPSHTPPQGVVDGLWLALSLNNNANTTIDAYPAGYDAAVEIAGTPLISNRLLSIRRRHKDAASEDPGGFTLSASRVWIAATLNVYLAPVARPAKADLTITGYAPTAAQVSQRLPAKADLTITGFAASVQLDVSVPKADLTVTGFAPTAQLDVSVSKADLTLTGFAASVQLNVSVPKADLTLAGFAPTAQTNSQRLPAGAALTITGFVPTLAADLEALPAKVDLTIAGFAPTAQQNSQRLPAAAALSLAGFASTTQIRTTPAFATLTLIGFAPTAQKVSQRLPAKADLTLTSFAATTQINVSVPKADLTLAGFTPITQKTSQRLPANADLTLASFAATTQLNVAVGKVDLILTGFIPSLAGELTPASADLTITGFAATVQLNVVGVAANLTLATTAPLVAQLLDRLPAAATLTIAGQTPVAQKESQRLPASVSLSLATTAPTAAQLIDRLPAKADLTLTGFAPTAQKESQRLPAQAALTLTAFAPTTQLNTVPAKTDLTLTTFAATTQLNVAGVKADLVLTGFAPTVQRSIIALPAKADLTLVGFAASSQINTTVGKADLTLTGFAPTLSAPLTALPAKADLTIATTAPTVEATLDITLTPAAATLTLTGFTPGENLFAPAQAALVVTSFAPVRGTGVVDFPAAATLTVSSSAPTIFVTDRVYANPPVSLLLNMELVNKRPTIQIDTRVAAQAVLTITTTPTSAGIGQIPDAAQLVLTPFAPFPRMEPATAQLTLTGFAFPSSITGIVANAALTLTTFAPQYKAEPAKADLILTPALPVRLHEVRRSPAAATLTITTSAPDVTTGVFQAPALLVIQGQFAECTIGKAWKVEDPVTGVWQTEFTLCDGVRDETIAEALADADAC